ncbi:uncharacterized protein LOC112154514 [Oryzias melastigma]|uniref:uncharacterized protein LOC112154514 n=1 Tax=Oryzias melastigma TaxID=30732 RepID=UPI000CF7F995|nr:uncharacterized protein LOC112154514 [Oryzias melastigma]
MEKSDLMGLLVTIEPLETGLWPPNHPPEMLLGVDQSDFEKKELDAELADLKMCLDSYESSLKSYSEARETEQRNLNSAKETLKKLEGNKNYAQTIRDIGIGLLGIPLFGWISGGIMVGVGQTDLNTAWEQIDKARQEVEKCDSQVKIYSQNVSDCKDLIAKTQAEIKEVSSRISKIQAEQKTVSVERETVAEITSCCCCCCCCPAPFQRAMTFFSCGRCK